MKLEAIMKRFPQTVESTHTLTHARDFMVWGDSHHFPIVDRASGRRVRDALSAEAHAFSEAQKHIEPEVQDVMDWRPQRVHPDDHVLDAAARMLAATYATVVPVADDDTRLVGVVSYVDLLRAFTH